jgi:hypothetical protein
VGIALTDWLTDWLLLLWRVPLVNLSCLTDIQQCGPSAPFVAVACWTSSSLLDGRAQFERLLRGKLKGRKENLSQSYLVHHKWQWNVAGRNPKLRGENQGNDSLWHCTDTLCCLLILWKAVAGFVSVKRLVVGGMVAAERGEATARRRKLHNWGPWKYNNDEKWIRIDERNTQHASQ